MGRKKKTNKKTQRKIKGGICTNAIQYGEKIKVIHDNKNRCVQNDCRRAPQPNVPWLIIC